jgi:carbon starvation protein
VFSAETNLLYIIDMNTLLIAGLLLAWLFVAYRIYGAFIEKKIIRMDPARATPACENCDNVDYSPAKKMLLFGHHFSSIAGAGPILGPLLAVMYFGWLGAVLWIALGSVFLGAVHDYTSLMASVRNGGRSIADISGRVLGVRSKTILSLFLWFALTLVIAVFAVVASQTLVSQPEIVVPTFGLILVAMVFGWAVYRKGLGVLPGTVMALAVLAFLIWAGAHLPISLPESVLGLPAPTIWFFILLIYSYFASSLPVWFLLQPRDYITTWILFVGLGLGYLGLVVARPELNAPAFAGFSSAGGPLWPMLFVIIACGAISGFHSVVAGGTTAKQLPDERSGRLIAFGGMLTEAALAGLVVLIAAAALVWDPAKTPSQFGFQYLMTEAGDPVKAFATGYGRITSSLPGMSLTMGLFFGMIMLNAFVLTSLDTGARLGRFILSELLGKKAAVFNHRWVASIVMIVFAAVLGATEGYKAIWPVFGASNQLVAALSLIVVTAWLVGLKRPRKATLYPALFMLVTTVAALLYQGISFLKAGRFLLGGISLVLVVLAAVIFADARKILLGISAPPGHPEPTA